MCSSAILVSPAFGHKKKDPTAGTVRSCALGRYGFALSIPYHLSLIHILCGTHPWPARQWTGSIENGWHEVYDIDPGIVLAAAEKIDSARAFLKGVQA